MSSPPEPIPRWGEPGTPAGNRRNGALWRWPARETNQGLALPIEWQCLWVKNCLAREPKTVFRVSMGCRNGRLASTRVHRNRFALHKGWTRDARQSDSGQFQAGLVRFAHKVDFATRGKQTPSSSRRARCACCFLQHCVAVGSAVVNPARPGNAVLWLSGCPLPHPPLLVPTYGHRHRHQWLETLQPTPAW